MNRSNSNHMKSISRLSEVIKEISSQDNFNSTKKLNHLDHIVSKQGSESLFSMKPQRNNETAE